MSVHDLLAVKESRKTVVVEGYLVKLAAGCTLMNCPDERPNCNTCEIEIRVAASPTDTEKTIGLFSKRFDYRCWTGSRAPCPVDAKGQKVRVRAKLHYIKELEHASLHEPVICELTP